jgi:hypothetical protein
MNFIFNDNVRILCLFCNVKKVGKLVRFKQKGQKQASFLTFHKGTSYEYDGYVFVAWVLQVRRAEVVTNDQPFPDMDPYFTEINHVLLASRGYEYDGFLFS